MKRNIERTHSVAASKKKTIADVSHFTCNVFLTVCIATCCATSPVLASDSDSYELSLTKSAPKIDGILDDPCWSSATVVDHFVKLCGKSMTTKKRVTTHAMLTSDGKNLYIGVRCEEPFVDKLKMRCKKHDGKVWLDDDVEIMIATNAPGASSYVQLAVNPAGSLTDLFYPGDMKPAELGYDCGALVKTRVNKRDWTLEMSIPLANLPIESPTGPWAFQIARARRTTDTTYLTSLRTPVSSFHSFHAYASLKGIGKLHIQLGLKSFSFGRLAYGQNICSFKVVGDKKKLTSMVIKVGGAPRMIFDNAALQIMTGTMKLPYVLSPADRGKKLVVDAYSGMRLLQTRMVDLQKLPEKLIGKAIRSVFMFYSGKVVEFSLPLHMTNTTKGPPLILEWSAKASNGDIVGRGVTTPIGETARIRLYWSFWQPGFYTIDCILKRNGRELARVSQKIRLVTNPWEVSQ